MEEQTYRTLKEQTRSLRKALSYVNTLAHDIDPRLTIMVWMNAISNALSTIGIWGAMGVGVTTFASTWMQNAHSAQIILAVLGVYVVVSTAIQALDQYTNTRERVFSDMLTLHLKDRFLEKICALDMGRLVDPQFAQISERAKTRGQGAVEALWRMQTKLLGGCVSVGIATSILLLQAPHLLLASLVLAVPSLLRAIALERYTRRVWEAEHTTRRRKEAYETALTQPEQLIQYLFLGIFRSLKGEYAKERDTLHQNEVKTQTYELRGELFLLGCKVVSVTFMLWMLYPLLQSGSIGFTMLFVLIGTMATCADGLSDFSKAVVEFVSKYRDIQYFTTFNDTSPLHEGGSEQLKLTATPPLRMEHVSFSYPDKEDLVLRDVTLMIQGGEKVLLRGANGSGKTTLLRLLAFMYSATKGTVYVAGTDSARYTHASVIEHMVFVLQGTTLPALPIVQAIAGTADMSVVETTRFRDAVTVSGVARFVETLSDGYKTRIGEEWEDGSGFSTGQRQRLLLATALYRLLDERVHVVFLDEALAHCDQEVKDTFYRYLALLTHKTVVVVAHDHTCMTLFDRAITLSYGEVESDVYLRKRKEQRTLTLVQG